MFDDKTNEKKIRNSRVHKIVVLCGRFAFTKAKKFIQKFLEFFNFSSLRISMTLNPTTIRISV